ncbi:unnamed protein product [Lactuca virosa]|uniref:Uncharacterized protein n=1 Tax=Lactuca virosa TaxID=75947 RepID=A0AAU9N3X7_9ASTR|nr:unnamed protein product [Lactuca virosa]
MEGLYLIFFHVQLYIEKTALYLMSTKYVFDEYKVLEGKAYRLNHPWVGTMNKSEADFIKNTDMIYARISTKASLTAFGICN